MKPKDLVRPDKILLKGLSTVTGLGQVLYSGLKMEAKAKAELTFIGVKKLEAVQNQFYTYGIKGSSLEIDVSNYEALKAKGKERKWLNFHGIHDVDRVSDVGDALGLDRLTVRRIVDTTQRPKAEIYDDHLFFSVKSMNRTGDGLLSVEHLSFVLGEKYVISFQEVVGDYFDGIRNKIEEGVGLIRKKSADYLLVQLLDAILDNYFTTIEQINAELVSIESQIINDPDKSQLIFLEDRKKATQVLKTGLGPMREALQTILNGSNGLIKRINVRFLKDLITTVTAAMEEVESTSKTLEGLTNIYFATQSQKMNETMKVLTTVATIFIPLTFIAGIYGMNFEYMPELSYPYGYYYACGFMGIVALGMIGFFKWKKWL